MNKSKFLKRPLAALLAILMVVALVPMSAFAAAGDPDVIKVGGVEATLSGDAYTVSMSVPSGTSGVVENALRNVTFELRTENGTKVGIINKDGAQNTTSLQGQPGTSSTRQSVDLLAYANKPEGSYWGDYTGIQLKVTTNDGVSTTYPLTITVSERNASSDTTIASVESTRIVAAEVDNTAKTIVITKPVGRDSTAKVLGLTKDNFKTTSPNADVNIGIDDPATESITKVVVTAEDKSTQVYTVSYKVETIFDEFSVPDMISYEENEDDDSGDVIITVKVPFGTFGTTSHIIPTFKPSENVKHIESANTSFTNDGGLYDRDNGQTTSGVADWSATTDDTDPDNGDQQVSFEFEVQTGKSSLADTTGNEGNGTVTVNFVPVANPAAKLTGVNVGDTNGAATYSQGPIEVANNVTSPTIIVGNIPNESLVDNDNNNNNANVVELTTRDIKLHVSKNAKVTVMNPWADNVDTVYDDSDDANSHDGVVTLDNVNLRKYHSKPMEILVEAEDGAYNHATRYYLTFNGTPSGKPVIQSVTLIDHNDIEYTVAPNKDGKATIKVAELPSNAWKDKGTGAIDWKISIKASNGATFGGVGPTSHYKVTDTVVVAGTVLNGPVNNAFELHAYYVSDKDASNNDICTKVELTMEEIGPNEGADITSLVLTDKTTLLEASTSKFPTTINPDEKTIRVEVPYDFAKDEDGDHVSTGLYAYSWKISDGATIHDGTDALAPFVVSNLDNQIITGAGNTLLVTEDDGSHTTTVAGEAAFDKQDNGIDVKVYSEKDTTSAAKPSTLYKLYFVRQNASGESKLNNVTATAPVRVALDTTVDKLNRYIITIPKDYNSTTGIGNAKEFELTFDRSEKSTVVNGQRTWVGKDDTSAKFKVADGKLYFNNEQVTLTDGRIIHFTVVAENGTSTGEYEFVVVEGEASKDATLKSVKVDDEVSFTQDGDKFIVDDLSENENYDVTKLPVVIETNDPGATVTVDGKDYIPEVTTIDLSEGKTAEVVVTAADEVTTATYTLSMKDGTTPDEKPSDKYDLSDVYSGHLEDVKKAIDMGLMSGTGAAGKFNPKGKIARQDFALIIARADMKAENPDAEDIDALLREKYADAEESFNDISGLNDTQKAAVAHCKENGIISGNDKGGFDPKGDVTRQHAAVMIAGWCGLEHDDTADTNNIKDWKNVANWAKPYVNAVYKAGLMSGTGSDNFSPLVNLERQQAATVLVGAYEKKNAEVE